MTQKIFKFDLPEDILYLILVYFDGRYKRRNGIFMFQIKYNILYRNIYYNLSDHYGNILKSDYIRNELFTSCITMNNNMEYIIRKYVKSLNLQNLYN
jgi:hypothetical protein